MPKRNYAERFNPAPSPFNGGGAIDPSAPVVNTGHRNRPKQPTHAPERGAGGDSQKFYDLEWFRFLNPSSR